MHEFSIVQSLLGLIEDYVLENRAKKVLTVNLRIGKLSGIEPSLLKMAFDTFKEKTVAQDAELIIEVEEISLRCKNCDMNSILKNFVFRCPYCQSLDIQMSGGEEMILETLELEQ